MKYFLGLGIVLVIILSSCGSSQKQLQKGNYDVAIDKAVKKLRKNPDKKDDAIILDKAYTIANEQDIERIKYLKLEGNSRSWDEVVQLYARLKNRQTLVRTVLPLKVGGRTIDYPYRDFDRELIEAKQNAADYFYSHGQQIMQNGTKESYRQAYYEFMQVKKYIGDYNDVDNLLMECREKGISRALVMVQNKTHLKFSPEFEENILTIDTRNLNNEWVEYHFKHLNENISYDYLIYVNLNVIDVSPDHVEEKDRIVKKKVQDGWEYVKDQRGNVMKDTLGNDIKLQKFKTLTCTVIETFQRKSAHVQGDIEVIQQNPAKLVKKDPVGAETVFEHHSARAIGDMDALTEEDKRMVEAKPLPFPPDVDMVYQGTETLKLAITDALRRNKRYIQ